MESATMECNGADGQAQHIMDNTEDNVLAPDALTFESAGCRKSPQGRHQQTLISPAASPSRWAYCSSPCSEDLSMINAAVAESPLTLSETYEDEPLSESPVRRSTASRLRRRRMFAGISFSSPSRSMYPKGPKWSTFSGNSSKKRLQHGWHVVKIKTGAAASKTQKGFKQMQALPMRSGFGKAKVRRSMLEIVGRVKVRARTLHVPETAQRSFDYIKERAVTASLMISDRVSETAKKGMKIAKDLARAGGA